MKVFMSWSGQRSKLTAELLHDWIKCVIQAAQPWISSKGIERGALWFSEINNELKDTSVGIICLTAENKDAPWILFEAGALAKGLANSRVCTFLVDLETADLQPPLSQFNHTFANYESMWSLVATLNNALSANNLELSVLKRVFDTYWPQFNAEFEKIINENPPVTVVTPRDDKEILNEILDTTRSMLGRVRKLEERENLTIDQADNARKNSFVATPVSVLEQGLYSDAINMSVTFLQGGMSTNGLKTRLMKKYGFDAAHALYIIELTKNRIIENTPETL
ncbi:hypothetical protein ACQ4WY_18810 [Janthinobacterium sp. LB2P49]|uniref:hypothetical protein n=1 Tax=Janthinobacterium sp. LB2P49 TaxID=3424198 RepID=UPI003F29E964